MCKVYTESHRVSTGEGPGPVWVKTTEIRGSPQVEGVHRKSQSFHGGRPWSSLCENNRDQRPSTCVRCTQKVTEFPRGKALAQSG